MKKGILNIMFMIILLGLLVFLGYNLITNNNLDRRYGSEITACNIRGFNTYIAVQDHENYMTDIPALGGIQTADIVCGFLGGNWDGTNCCRDSVMYQ